MILPSSQVSGGSIAPFPQGFDLQGISIRFAHVEGAAVISAMKVSLISCSVLKTGSEDTKAMFPRIPNPI